MISKTSIALLLVQLALIASVAATYLHQRRAYPRVWAQAVANDPSLPMRGRYLSLKLTVDGCRSTLPSAKLAEFPRNLDGTIRRGSSFSIHSPQPVPFLARLKVENGHLLAIRPDGVESTEGAQSVTAPASAPCSAMMLDQPVDYFIADRAQSPLPLKAGQQLWIEVTIPPAGPPRPLQLAVKDNDTWKPLGLK
jgi:hypothetical protein